jgi:hypothetical protein
MLFGAGPRVCPGQYLAVTDIKVSEDTAVCCSCCHYGYQQLGLT